MATREENLNRINSELEKLSDEELDQVAGGTFYPNKYRKDQYWDAGIQVIDHFFKKDEFIWNGENIGHINANDVTFFKRKTGQMPQTVQEAINYRNEHFDDYLNDNVIWGNKA